MTDPIDLDALKSDANYQQCNPLSDSRGPWSTIKQDDGTWMIVADDGSIVAVVPKGHYDMVARYLASVSPPAVLALIEMVRRAKAEAATEECWVVTYYQPGEGPSEVESVHRSEAAALRAMAHFRSHVCPAHWDGDGGYWVNSLTGAVLQYHREVWPCD